jgi:hypothetical protein
VVYRKKVIGIEVQIWTDRGLEKWLKEEERL